MPLAQASGSNAAAFARAKRELAPNVYFTYRIVDRLARANGLDQMPWRIQVVKEYNVNAYATEANLLAIYTGLLDMLAGDSSAIACVLGHEMAHHTQRHIPLKQLEAAMAQQRVEQTRQELIRKEQSKQSTSQGFSILSAILGRATGVYIPNPIPSRNPNQDIRKGVNEATISETERVTAKGRDMEFEADRHGLQYMATAGFKPEGCLRVMEVLGRMPAAEFDGSHPAIPKRKEQLQALIQDSPLTQLANTGRAKLTSSRPLTYTRSEDGASLRVNSRFGSAGRDGDLNDL